MAIVESQYQVEMVGDGPSTWSLPVGLALDLSATMDDHPAPLRIAADGLSATVGIVGDGDAPALVASVDSTLEDRRGGRAADGPDQPGGVRQGQRRQGRGIALG